MNELVTSAGGKIVNDKKKNEADLWIVDQDKDKKVIDGIAKLGKKGNDIKVCGMELILDAILKQKLDIKKHSIKKK